MKNAIFQPRPPDFKRHVVSGYDLNRIFGLINEPMLYCKYLGLKTSAGELFPPGDSRALELRARVEALKAEAAGQKWIRPAAIYSFFRARGSGDSILLLDGENSNTVRETFVFPRQGSGEKLCLSDFLSPAAPGETDSLALFVLTCGRGVSEKAAQLRTGGELAKSHLLNILSIVCAEAFAEALHEDISRLWGSHGPEGLSKREKLRAKRFSFGYPACPELSNQVKLFNLLKPEEIGITLTENFMMSPEASISALVFHSSAAKHFSVS